MALNEANKSNYSEKIRQQRGKAIADQGGQIKKINDHLFKVKSQSSSATYEVKETEFGTTCTCPDYVYRGKKCKHIMATKYYLQVEKETPTGTVIEKVRLTYPQAWDAYNAAQKAEVRLFDELLKDLVNVIEEPYQNLGRPRTSIHEKLFVAIQKVYSQLSSRRAYSLFENAVERGQIENAPHFNTPSKILNSIQVTPILHKLVTLSALPVAGIEEDFSVDSTGFRTNTFSAYCGDKYGRTKEHRWIKAHLCAGVKTNVVAAVSITDEDGADSPEFGPLIKKTAKGFAIGEVTADLAYSARTNLQTVANLGGKAYIPFKRNATGTAKGSTIWKKMFHYFQLNRDEFMDHYHKRSNIEATNAAIKRKFGETLKSKNQVAQVNELLAKIVAYNLTVIIHEMYENGVELKSRHTFLILTKFPDRIREVLDPISRAHDIPDNLWVGVSITREEIPGFSRLDDLRAYLPKAHKFVSFEPLHGPVHSNLEGIEWVITGAETGNRKGKIEPEAEWIKSLAGEAQDAGIPLFIKGNAFAYCPREWPLWDKGLLQQIPEAML